MSKNKRNFWLDLSLVFTFLITIVSGALLWLVIPGSFYTGLAGVERGMWIAIHEGSGFLGLLGVILHVVWHWDWLKALRGRALEMLKKPVRLNRLVDRITWFAFISTYVFGMLAWLLSASMPGAATKILGRLHTATSLFWLVFLVIHLGLHQKWIALTVKQLLIHDEASRVILNNQG